jgi:cell division septum initiation protein DivIVA
MTEKRFTHKDKSLYIDDDYFCELEDGDEIIELLNRQQYTVETVWKENEQLKQQNSRLMMEVAEYSRELRKCKGDV